jgi:hypothetical protein
MSCISHKVFSRLTGFFERAIAKWELGGRPDEPGPRRIRESQRLQAKLAEVVPATAMRLRAGTMRDLRRTQSSWPGVLRFLNLCNPLF